MWGGKHDGIMCVWMMHDEMKKTTHPPQEGGVQMDMMKKVAQNHGTIFF